MDILVPCEDRNMEVKFSSDVAFMSFGIGICDNTRKTKISLKLSDAQITLLFELF